MSQAKQDEVNTKSNIAKRENGSRLLTRGDANLKRATNNLVYWSSVESISDAKVTKVERNKAVKKEFQTIED